MARVGEGPMRQRVMDFVSGRVELLETSLAAAGEGLPDVPIFEPVAISVDALKYALRAVEIRKAQLTPQNRNRLTNMRGRALAIFSGLGSERWAFKAMENDVLAAFDAVLSP